MAGITVEDLEQHIRDLYSKVKLIVLVSGNLYKEVSNNVHLKKSMLMLAQEAINIADMTESILNSAPEPSQVVSRAYIIPKGKFLPSDKRSI
jgi:hypothetical protein